MSTDPRAQYGSQEPESAERPMEEAGWIGTHSLQLKERLERAADILIGQLNPSTRRLEIPTATMVELLREAAAALAAPSVFETLPIGGDLIAEIAAKAEKGEPVHPRDALSLVAYAKDMRHERDKVLAAPSVAPPQPEWTAFRGWLVERRDEHGIWKAAGFWDITNPQAANVRTEPNTRIVPLYLAAAPLQEPAAPSPDRPETREPCDWCGRTDGTHEPMASCWAYAPRASAPLREPVARNPEAWRLCPYGHCGLPVEECLCVDKEGDEPESLFDTLQEGAGSVNNTGFYEAYDPNCRECADNTTAVPCWKHDPRLSALAAHSVAPPQPVAGVWLIERLKEGVWVRESATLCNDAPAFGANTGYRARPLYAAAPLQEPAAQMPDRVDIANHVGTAMSAAMRTDPLDVEKLRAIRFRAADRILAAAPKEEEPAAPYRDGDPWCHACDAPIVEGNHRATGNPEVEELLCPRCGWGPFDAAPSVAPPQPVAWIIESTRTPVPEFQRFTVYDQEAANAFAPPASNRKATPLFLQEPAAPIRTEPDAYLSEYRCEEGGEWYPNGLNFHNWKPSSDRVRVVPLFRAASPLQEPASELMKAMKAGAQALDGILSLEPPAAPASPAWDEKEYERLRGALLKAAVDPEQDSQAWREAVAAAERALDAYVLAHVRTAAAPSTATLEGACEWNDDYHGSDTWESACGVTWQFFDGGPNENRMKHCPGCGKPVAEVRGGAAPGGERTP